MLQRLGEVRGLSQALLTCIKDVRCVASFSNHSTTLKQKKMSLDHAKIRPTR